MDLFHTKQSINSLIYENIPELLPEYIHKIRVKYIFIRMTETVTLMADFSGF